MTKKQKFRQRLFLSNYWKVDKYYWAKRMDTDNDGIKNIFDCKPLDPRHQDLPVLGSVHFPVPDSVQQQKQVEKAQRQQEHEQRVEQRQQQNEQRRIESEQRREQQQQIQEQRRTQREIQEQQKRESIPSKTTKMNK